MNQETVPAVRLPRLRSEPELVGSRPPSLPVGSAEIRPLSGRPPRTIQAAQHVAAEHYAFCNE